MGGSNAASLAENGQPTTAPSPRSEPQPAVAVSPAPAGPSPSMPAATTGAAPAPAPSGVSSGGAGLNKFLDFVSLLEDALDQVLADEEADRELARIPFRPDTDEKAAWLGRLVLEIQERRARLKATFEAQDGRLGYEVYHLARRFGPELADWLRSRLSEARGSRARSVRFDEGMIGLRKTKGGIRLKKEEGAREAATKWAELREDPAAPKWGRFGYTVDLRRLAAYAEEAGELPDGFEVALPEDELYVRSDLKNEIGRQAFPSVNLTKLGRAAPKAIGHDDNQNENEGE